MVTNKKIILASASPQRRKLMKILGLPFIVKPSCAHEKTVITTTVGALVKDNALIKARDVASRLKQGLVIGCDTVVLSHKGRLILKPKDLAQAKKNLKELMEKPHWVYSGLAVIDASTGKALTAIDKTKIKMAVLSDSQIDNYHKLVSPLDKAGGFDIEGKGSLFIPSIKGCFYNVVGLPISKLVKLLEQFGVKVL